MYKNSIIPGVKNLNSQQKIAVKYKKQLSEIKQPVTNDSTNPIKISWITLNKSINCDSQI